MRIKDGVIPTVVGTVVTAGAAALRAKDMKSMRMNKHNIVPMAETALLGFGFAHVVLGAIDLIQHD
ncbi:hypothetical protein J2Z44_001103 [Clostridium punense]|uniref:Asparagine synthase n=1 Tax=Clostridium punense TaxID=1054297 RepID=A0ABS4K0I8_9CLOT|nr:asparagine synthase [Clostridium punense]MBP2021312.1 hypothetical protein [Clostridium punense]